MNCNFVCLYRLFHLGKQWSLIWVILCQMNIFYYWLTQTMTTVFVGFTKINKHKLIEIQNLCFEFQNNWQNLLLYFGLIGDKICWSDKKQPVIIFSWFSYTYWYQFGSWGGNKQPGSFLHFDKFFLTESPVT